MRTGPNKKELEAIRTLLQQNPDSPLAQLLREAQGGAGAGSTLNMQHPAAAMQVTVHPHPGTPPA